MRQKELTRSIIQYAKQYFQEIDADNIKHNLMALKTAIDNLSPSSPYKTMYDGYIQFVHDNYSGIIQIKPDGADPFSWYESQHTELSSITEEALAEKLKIKPFGKENELSFANWMIEAMDYNGSRSIYWKYAKKMRLHTCVYCNIQFVDVFLNKKGELKSTSTIDHYKSKTSKPYLCTSFFNYMPACAHCNQVKKTNDIPFYLYHKPGSNAEEILFSLDSASIIKYLRSFNPDDLVILLKESEPTHDKDYIHRLDLRQIYQEHKDIAEEVLWRNIVYNETQRNALQTQFPLLLQNVDYDRFILGTFASPEDVYMRPLTKMRQDIWKQSQSNFLYNLISFLRGMHN